jgi:hypothetical protein
VAEFAPLAAAPGVSLLSLQRDGSADLADAPFPVTDLGPELDLGPDGFTDTAAALANLDLLVSSDTALAHLAGALGRPVWLLLAYPGTPQWGTVGGDCPDYPTMRIFRLKDHGGRWPELFSRVARQLWRLTPAATAAH